MFHSLKRRLAGFVLHDPNIARYLGFRMLIKRFVVPVLSLFAIDVGLTLQQIAIIAMVSSIVALVLEVPSGMLSDKWGHKKTLVVAQIGSTIAMAMYIPAYFGNGFVWLLIAAIIYFAAGAFLSGTTSAILYEYLDAHGKVEHYGKLRGRIKGMANAVGIVTLAIAGLLYGVHPLIPFVVGVLQFAGSAYLISRFDDSHADKHETESVSAREGFMDWLKHFPNAWKQMRADTRIFWMTLLVGLVSGVRYVNGEFEQVLFTNAEILPFVIGLSYSVKRTVSTLTLFFSYRLSDKMSTSAIAAFGAIGTGLTFVGFWLLPLTIAIVIPVLVSTFLAYFVDLGFNERINQLIDKGSRATVLSMGGLVMSLIGVVLPLWYAVGAAWFHLQELMAFVGIATAAVSVIGTWRLYEGYRAAENV